MAISIQTKIDKLQAEQQRVRLEHDNHLAGLNKAKRRYAELQGALAALEEVKPKPRKKKPVSTKGFGTVPSKISNEDLVDLS